MPVKVIVLERDGVINEDSDDCIKSVDEWIPIPGSIEALSRLKKAGLKVAVASNQSGLARGMFSEKDLQAMHDKLHGLLAQRGESIDAIYFCPHGPAENCVCRMPKPGMLLQAAKQFSVKQDEMLFVGDSYSDLQAATLAGCKSALVKTGKGERTLNKYGSIQGVPVYANLSQFVREFLRGR